VGFSQIFWLLTNPLTVHGIGESSCQRKFQSLLGSWQLPIKPDGFATNPYNGSLPGPNRCSFQHNLAHRLILFFKFIFWTATVTNQVLRIEPTPLKVPCGIQT